MESGYHGNRNSLRDRGENGFGNSARVEDGPKAIAILLGYCDTIVNTRMIAGEEHANPLESLKDVM